MQRSSTPPPQAFPKTTDTSPVKSRPPVTQHRQGLSQQLKATRALSPTATFVRDHLRCPEKQLENEIAARIEEDVTKFTSNTSHTLSYAKACAMLNNTSKGIGGE
jgi:hypothetical protein